MEPISSIVNVKKHSLSMERIMYVPYKIEKSVAYFLAIGCALVGDGADVPFQIVKGNEGLFFDLIRYVHADPECTLNTSRALGLIGGTGGGKSLAFKLIQEYMKIDDVKYIKNGKIVPFRFNIHSARSIMSDYQQNGFSGIEKYLIPNIICIDDLGAEISEVSHYGNKINVMEHIIEERYLHDKITHFSSNIDAKGIEAKYGQRVYSRICGSTNLITVLVPDWRMVNTSRQ